jgi:hypothetical protein
MLGICTVFKEHMCYTQKKHDTPELLYLNTLLSNLVEHERLLRVAERARQKGDVSRDPKTKQLFGTATATVAILIK